MNTNSLIKYKDLALKVIYYTKKRQLGSKIFFATSKFQDVLAYFDKNLKDSQTFLKSCYFLNGKQIYPSDILLYFCTVDPNLRLVEEDMFLEIEELEHLDDASEPIYEKILKPLVNPFKLIILNIKDGILQMVDFPKDKVIELGLDTINENYACCNSTDSLYLSCGKNFWIISHNTFQIEKKEMPFFKEKHSMTYILSNNTIFIAGGSEESFYYDINTKEFIIWGKMNGIQEQPALIQFGDILFSFNSFNQSGIYFEKTKLKNLNKIWEKIIPQSGDQDSGFFYNKLYGVSKCSGGNILFAGGINNQLRTFIYNIKSNVLFINPSKDESIALNERTFYKIDHNFNIAIPKNVENDHIIAIVNKNSKALHLIPFEQIGIKARNTLLRFDNPRNRLPGNIIIQCRYMALKDYENFLKQKEMQQNNKTKGGFDIYNRKEQGKKLGDKLNPNPYRYQYRGKTPALERISEGKSDEEYDEDDFGKNRSNSAKKEKRTLDLGLKLENIGKYNFATQKKDEDEDKKVENEEKIDNQNNQNNNNVEINNKIENENKVENENIIESKNIIENENEIKENKEIIENKDMENKEKLENKENITTNENKENITINENKENINLNSNNNIDINQDADIYNSINSNKKETNNEENTPTQKDKIKSYTEIKQSNLEEKKLAEISMTQEKKEEMNLEIQDKIYNSQNDKLKENIRKKGIKEVKHKKLDLNVDKKEEGKNNESDLSSTPHSNKIDNNNPNTKIYNTIASGQSNNMNINMNINKKMIYRVKKDTNNNMNMNINTNINEINRNLNINLNHNFNNMNKLENKGNENGMNMNMNININSKGNIQQKAMMENKNKNYSNLNQNINNMYLSNEQKKNNNVSKKIIQNSKENNIIQKSNTTFINTQKNYQTMNVNNNNYSSNSNPFIDNSKYQNIGEKETYQLREEAEPNANKIPTYKNNKTIKEIKKLTKKTSYKTNTITSMPNNQGSLIQSNPINNNNNSQTIDGNNIKMSSYKASTHKQVKGKKLITLSHNQNTKINISTNNEQENANYTQIPMNKKIFKSNISPEQRNRISAQKINIQTEENRKPESYGEMYSKINKYQNQRLNTSTNIDNSGNNSIRIMKSGTTFPNQHNFSNEKIIRKENNMRNNKTVITKDGKRYVLAKNVQRVRREEEDKNNKYNDRSNNFTIDINRNENGELINNK